MVEGVQVESPCIHLCQLDAEDVCIGCYRHLDEISGWNNLSNEMRNKIIVNAEQRKLNVVLVSKVKK